MSDTHFNCTDTKASTSGGASTLDGLTDVAATSPTHGDVISYNSGSGDWEKGAPIPVYFPMDSLTDVAATSPTDGDMLRYDSGSGDWQKFDPTDTVVGKIISFEFNRTGTLTSNQWLYSTYPGEGERAMEIVPFACKVIGFTFSGQDVSGTNNFTGDFELHRATISGGTTTDTVHTFSISNKRVYGETNVATGFGTLAQGDKIAFKTANVTTNGAEPTVVLYVMVTADSDTTFSENYEGNFS